MGFQVYDYRQDMRNVLVTPEIRARFMRLEVGEISGGAQPGRGHSHDLGHEVFMILQGQAEFEIAGETHVLGPGQMCVAMVDETHTVRNVGDEPVIMYLSVTPHIQPTHTMWETQDGKAPPRFVPSTTYDVPPDKETPSAELADRQLEAAEALSAATQRATAIQRELLQVFKQAVEARDKQAALSARDAMWEALYPMYRGMYALAEAWNALTYRTADPEFVAE